MADIYEYEACDSKGQRLKGTMLADDATAVAAAVQRQGCYILHLNKRRKPLYIRLQWFLRPMPLHELAMLCRQFAVMLAAGMTLVSCLKVLAEQYKGRLGTALTEVLFRVNRGEMLSVAVAACPQAFTPEMSKVVAAGEMTGALDAVLEKFAIQLQHRYYLREKLHTAVAYPAIVLVVAISSVLLLFIFVLPPFAVLYQEMGIVLPPLTAGLIAASDCLGRHAVLVSSMLIGACYAAVIWSRRPSGRLMLEKLLLKVPLLSNIFRQIIIARANRILALLLASGVPLLDAVGIAGRSTGSIYMDKVFACMARDLRAGQSFSQALAVHDVFPTMAVQMAVVGEETGRLDDLLRCTADFYEESAQETLLRGTTLIEPLLIVLLGIIIGTLFLAVLMPLFNLLEILQQSH